MEMVSGSWCGAWVEEVLRAQKELDSDSEPTVSHAQAL